MPRPIRLPPQIEANYIIFKDGNYTKAKNGTTGKIDFTDTDAARVLQAAFDALPQSGGKIVLYDGTYMMKTSWDARNRSNVSIEGQGGNTILYADPATEINILVLLNLDTRPSASVATLTTDVSIGSTVIFADSTSGLQVGDKITIYGLTYARFNLGKVKSIDSATQFTLEEETTADLYSGDSVFPFNWQENIHVSNIKFYAPPDYPPDKRVYGLPITGRNHLMENCQFINDSAARVGAQRTLKGNWGTTIKDCIFKKIYGESWMQAYMKFVNNTWTGINTGESGVGDCYSCLIKNNIMINSSRRFFWSNQADHTIIEGNLIVNSRSTGPINIASGKGVKITNNTIYKTEGTGIHVQDDEIDIVGNYVIGSTDVGIGAFSTYTFNQCRITDNYIKPSSGDAIRVRGNDNLVQNNFLLPGDSATNGIEISTGSDNIIRNNMIKSFPTALVDNGTNSVIKYNRGYATENSGAATILSGSTSINVAHELADVPTRVHITLTSSLGAASEIYVSNKDILGDSTAFQVSVDVDPTQDVTFDWRATVGEGN